MEKLSPKEEAKRLIILYLDYEPSDWNDIEVLRDVMEAKRNAYKCVSEILKVIKYWNIAPNLYQRLKYSYFTDVGNEIKNF